MDLQLRSSCLGVRRLRMEGVQMTAVFKFTVDCLLSIRFCEVTKALLFYYFFYSFTTLTVTLPWKPLTCLTRLVRTK